MKNSGNVKAKAKVPTLTPILTNVLIGEKEMNFSPRSPVELDPNVKWVKTGRRKSEGWERKVFKMPRCQQAIRPMMKPGRKIVERAAAGRTLPAPHMLATAEARATPLPTSAQCAHFTVEHG